MPQCRNFFLKLIPATNYPLKIRGLAGGLLNNTTPYACGGLDPTTSSCYMYKKPNWVPMPSMLTNRYHFQTLTIPGPSGAQSQIFATGNDKVKFSEIFDGTKWVKTNMTDPPANFFISCLTYGNDDNTLVLTGGYTDYNQGTSVLLISLKTLTWTNGPSLNNRRFGHTCGRMINSDNTVIVAGGFSSTNYDPTSSVEFLKPGASSWVAGIQLQQSL